MSELQGSPIEETEPEEKKVLPKMVDGKRKCEPGFSLKMDEDYRNTVDAINSRKNRKTFFYF